MPGSGHDGSASCWHQARSESSPRGRPGPSVPPTGFSVLIPASTPSPRPRPRTEDRLGGNYETAGQASRLSEAIAAVAKHGEKARGLHTSAPSARTPWGARLPGTQERCRAVRRWGAPSLLNLAAEDGGDRDGCPR